MFPPTGRVYICLTAAPLLVPGSLPLDAGGGFVFIFQSRSSISRRCQDLVVFRLRLGWVFPFRSFALTFFEKPTSNNQYKWKAMGAASMKSATTVIMTATTMMMMIFDKYLFQLNKICCVCCVVGVVLGCICFLFFARFSSGHCGPVAHNCLQFRSRNSKLRKRHEVRNTRLTKSPLSPHHKHYTAQYEEHGFSSLTQMKDDYTDNYHYIAYSFGRICLF